MNLGGFVIHGNSAETLGACLSDLKSVCDVVVAIDSDSTDGSAELVRQAGVKGIRYSWRGYGAARRRAVEALRGCDYVFFLDSDEWLGEGTAKGLLHWKTTSPSLPVYRLVRRDWAILPHRRFVFRTEHRSRLIRFDAASWSDNQIVHESIPSPVRQELEWNIEHRFATDVENRLERNSLYALLWSIREASSKKRLKWPPGQRWSHFIRNAVLKGAAWRGGFDGLKLSWQISEYHALKYEYLKRVLEGEFAQIREKFEQGHYDEVFRLARQENGRKARKEGMR